MAVGAVQLVDVEISRFTSVTLWQTCSACLFALQPAVGWDGMLSRTRCCISNLIMRQPHLCCDGCGVCWNVLHRLQVANYLVRDLAQNTMTAELLQPDELVSGLIAQVRLAWRVQANMQIHMVTLITT